MILILKINKLKCSWLSQGHPISCGPPHTLSSRFMYLPHEQKQIEPSSVVSAFFIQAYSRHQSRLIPETLGLGLWICAEARMASCWL